MFYDPVIYKQPYSSMVAVPDIYDNIKFNSKANVKTDHCNTGIAVDNENLSLLVLENNITVSVTKNFYAEELGNHYLGILKNTGELHIAGNNAAKTISVTVKFTKDASELASATAIRLSSSKLSIYGPEFLYTIKASANNSAVAQAIGIFCSDLESAAVICKPITVQAKSTNYGSLSQSFGMLVFGKADFYTGITGNIQAKSTSAKGYALACGIRIYGDLTIYRQLASKINVSASGNIQLESYSTEAIGILSETAKTNIHNISKSITVSAKDTGKVISHAIDAYSELLILDAFPSYIPV